MISFLPTTILRHRKENLKKCSLRGLEQRADFRFYTYPIVELPDLSEYLILSIDAPPLTKEDQQLGIFLIDATWRYASKMAKVHFPQKKEAMRSIPEGFQTAYPRTQEDCPDPAQGLASIEALYIAYCILGRDPTGLLDNYHWKDPFLQKNQIKLAGY